MFSARHFRWRSLRGILCGAALSLGVVSANAQQTGNAALPVPVFATFASPWSHELTMVNAGAIPPLICRNGEMVKVKVEGVPIGLLDEREYEETVFKSQPGDLILLCSDGVLDQLNAKEDEYGRHRLVKVMKRVSDQEPGQIAEEILKDLDAFTEGRRRFDDQTVLALKVRV